MTDNFQQKFNSLRLSAAGVLIGLVGWLSAIYVHKTMGKVIFVIGAIIVLIGFIRLLLLSLKVIGNKK